MTLEVSTKQRLFKTLEYVKKKGATEFKELFPKNQTRTENCEFSYYNFANFLGFCDSI